MRLRAYACFIALAIVLAPTVSLAAESQTAAVMAPLNQFMSGINHGDLSLSAAACASPASVLDDFPPHSWVGPTACADWAKAFAADNTSTGTTDIHVTLGTPWHVAVTGDRAYVVVPATNVYKVHGKPMTETGSVWTVALQKLAAGWRIKAWAWAQH